MMINGVDYFVLLMVGDLSSEDVKSFHFVDFHEFNAFVRKNKDNLFFQNNTLNYTLAENINGEPGNFMWTEEIVFEEFSEEKIAEEIEGQQGFFQEVAALSAESEKREICYQTPKGDASQKTCRIQDFTYVCPYCVREVHDCRCENYPYFLIQVDTLIVPIIRELNAKGYKTTGCCAGHPEQGVEHSTIYVAFDQEYDFDEPFPEGAEWSTLKHCISFEPPCSDYDELVEFQRHTLYKLGDWAEMLFERE